MPAIPQEADTDCTRFHFFKFQSVYQSTELKEKQLDGGQEKSKN